MAEIIHVRFEGIEELERDLRALGADFPAVFLGLLKQVAENFVAWIKGTFLSGGMFHSHRGKMRKDFRIKRAPGVEHGWDVFPPQLTPIFEHEGGATIKVKAGGYTTRKRLKGGVTKITRYREARALRFYVNGKPVFTKKPVHIARRPFWSTAYSSYDFQGSFDREAEAAAEAELRKHNLK